MHGGRFAICYLSAEEAFQLPAGPRSSGLHFVGVDTALVRCRWVHCLAADHGLFAFVELELLGRLGPGMRVVVERAGSKRLRLRLGTPASCVCLLFLCSFCLRVLVFGVCCAYAQRGCTREPRCACVCVYVCVCVFVGGGGRVLQVLHRIPVRESHRASVSSLTEQAAAIVIM
jgi:hypothetical protein